MAARIMLHADTIAELEHEAEVLKMAGWTFVLVPLKTPVAVLLEKRTIFDAQKEKQDG